MYVALAGMALGLHGCERADSEYEQAVSKARDSMAVLMAGGTWPAADEVREPKLAQIISDLNRAMARVDGDAKGPAQLIVARATAGQAGISMSAANEVAVRIVLDVTRADAIAREYSANRAFASRLVGPDAGQAIQSIEGEIRQIDAESRDLESNRQALENELAGVRSEIAQLLESARAERLEEADLRNESFNAEPMQRAELIRQAAERARAAEAYERTGAEKDLTVDSLEIAIEQVERIIASQLALRQIQTGGLERITQVDRDITQRRQERDQVTSQTLADYSAALDAVIAQYENEFVSAVENAASQFQSAANLARQARAMGQLASASAGEHSSSAARVHELHAQVASRIAASAMYLVDIEASNISRYRQIVQRFNAAAEAALAEAADAYDQAGAAFGATGSDGQMLSDRYMARAAELRGETPQEAQDPMGDDGVFDDDFDYED